MQKIPVEGTNLSLIALKEEKVGSVGLLLGPKASYIPGQLVVISQKKKNSLHDCNQSPNSGDDVGGLSSV